MPRNPCGKQLPNTNYHEIQPRYPRRGPAQQSAINSRPNNNNRRLGIGNTSGTTCTVASQATQSRRGFDRQRHTRFRADRPCNSLRERQAGETIALASIGVKHVTSSTYKIKPDNWRRFYAAMPGIAEKLKPLYFKQGEKMGGNTMLPRDLRFKLMKNLRDLAKANGMKFGVCREGLPQLNTAACDGSWLLNAEPR